MKLSCHKIRALIIESECGSPLDRDLQVGLQEHVSSCDSCRAFQEDIRYLLHHLQAIPPLPTLPDNFFEELKNEILDTVEPPSSLWRRCMAHGRDFFSRHTVLVPAMVGVLGLIIGVIMTTAWMRLGNKAPSFHQIQALANHRELISLTPSSKHADVFPGIDEIGGIVNTEDILDSMGNKEVQTLLTHWSKDLPADLTEIGDGGSG